MLPHHPTWRWRRFWTQCRTCEKHIIILALNKISSSKEKDIPEARSHDLMEDSSHIRSTKRIFYRARSPDLPEDSTFKKHTVRATLPLTIPSVIAKQISSNALFPHKGKWLKSGH